MSKMSRDKAFEVMNILRFGTFEEVINTREIVNEALDVAIEVLRTEKICPVFSDNEVKQPCINCLECELEQPQGDCRDRLKEVFREHSSISGDMFHLYEIERIIDGEVWL